MDDAAQVLEGSVAGTAGQRVGAYLLRELIGHGGMGEVFAAVRADGQYETRVALKRVRSGRDSGAVLERLRKERQILAGLDHPNIARLLDGGTAEDGTPYLVMERVDGTPIDAYCDARKLPLAERLQLFRQVCSAVQYAHQHLVIHRDIKPGNILVTADGTPKLLDFGIAKILDASGTAEATVLRPMTPEFASPEQVGGGAITTATDVYSLGVVLYRLLTGRSPYDVHAGNATELAQAICSREPDRPSRRGRRQLRGDLDSILLKALRKEPERRYSSVEQFSEDVRRHLEGLPVLARKGTWSYVAGRFLRRNAPAVAATAALPLALLATVIVTQHETRIAEANQRRAEARFDDVRKLANSLLFEINDSIKDIAGATQARHLILQRSLEYLDRLAAESGSDPALLRELATAYSRIGAIQGNPQEANVGDAKAALQSSRKAIRIRESLVALNPDNRKDRMDLALAYLDDAELQMGAVGDVAAGFEAGRRAVAALDREVAASPDDPEVLAQAVRGHKVVGMLQVGEGAMGHVGNTADGVAHLQKALELNDRRSRLSPGADARRQEALLSALLGDALFKLGDRPRALELYRRSLERMKSLDPQGRNPRIASNAAIVTGKIGDVFLTEGRFAEAVPYYAEGDRQESRLAAADPHNELLLRGASTQSSSLGFALLQAGRIEEGVLKLQRAIALIESDPSRTPLVDTLRGIYHAWIGDARQMQGRIEDAVQEYSIAQKLHAGLLAAGDQDVRMKVYFVLSTDGLASARLRQGDVASAAREYAESLALLEPLRDANPDDQELLYALAQTYTGSGMVAIRSAAAASSGQERLSRWQDARDWFRKSLGAWSAISHPARISTSGIVMTMPGEVSRQLARCDRQIGLLVPQAH